jgi:hypothetical protein
MPAVSTRCHTLTAASDAGSDPRQQPVACKRGCFATASPARLRALLRSCCRMPMKFFTSCPMALPHAPWRSWCDGICSSGTAGDEIDGVLEFGVLKPYLRAVVLKVEIGLAKPFRCSSPIFSTSTRCSNSPCASSQRRAARLVTVPTAP